MLISSLSFKVSIYFKKFIMIFSWEWDIQDSDEE